MVDRKTIPPVKTTASKPPGTVVCVSRWVATKVRTGVKSRPKYPVDNPTCLLQKEGMKSFDLSHEDSQNKNDW